MATKKHITTAAIAGAFMGSFASYMNAYPVQTSNNNINWERTLKAKQFKRAKKQRKAAAKQRRINRKK